MIDQIAQNVALLFGKNAVRIGGILLLDFLLELVALADVFRARDDLVVDPADDLFDHGIGGQKSGKQQRTQRQQQGKSASSSFGLS